MNKTIGIACALLTLASAAEAQRRPGTIRPAPERAVRMAPPARPLLGVESVLRLKDELKLTEAQVAQLETLRREQVAERQEQARTRIDLESRIAAGLLDRDQARTQVRAQLDKTREQLRQSRDRVEKILTEEQRTRLREERIERARIAMRRAGFGKADLPARFGPRPRFR